MFLYFNYYILISILHCNMEGFTAQSVKQNFRVDIEDSRKIKTSQRDL